MPDVLFEKRPDGVGLITLNRPESLNALGGDVLPLLGHYLEDCERDHDVRCVALTGAGRAFCAGGDVRAMQTRNTSVASESGGANLMTVLNQLTDELRRSHNATSLRLHTMAKPTVALVNGHAVGAGFSLALACDIRIASENAKFGSAFRNVGLSGDYGGSYFLQRLVGMGRARELYFSAEVLDAQRALEMGIVNQVVPHEHLLAAGLAYCAKLASGPTASYGRMKKNLDLGATGTLQEVLDQEALLMRISSLSRDSREAVLAFLEKRDPNFAGE